MGNMYSTCPNTCVLKPEGVAGSDSVDEVYFTALLDAVPKGGCSWTYTHFEPSESFRPKPGKTVVNVSADNQDQAVAYAKLGFPTVVALPSNRQSRVESFDGVRFVRCPAEYNDKVTCNNCGGKTPLCARPDRDYVVKFTAHGQSAKLVGEEKSGGCYGSGGPVAIHWRKTSKIVEEKSDAEVLTEFVHRLPYGTKIRHHVVGDIGIY